MFFLGVRTISVFRVTAQQSIKNHNCIIGGKREKLQVVYWVDFTLTDLYP
jgi:hypothetical protein